MANLEQSRIAKGKVLAMLANNSNVNGVGIMRLGSGYALKVNLTRKARTSESFPSEIDGVPIEFEVVGEVGIHHEAGAARPVEDD